MLQIFTIVVIQVNHSPKNMSSDTMIVLNQRNFSIIEETDDYLERQDLPLIPLPAASQSGPDLICFLIYALSGFNNLDLIYNCYRHLSNHFDEKFSLRDEIVKFDFSRSEFNNILALSIFINTVRIQYKYSGKCWYELVES